MTRLANLARVSPPTIGSPVLVEEAAQHFAAPVSLAYLYWESWTITLEGQPTLKKVDLSLGIAAGDISAAFQNATSSIPIVVGISADPVRAQLVPSLARSGAI